MRVFKIVRVGLLGAALATVGLATVGRAETLRVLQGSVVAPIQVPMNRAAVVESDTPFAELSIANPGIADVSTLTDRSVYILGKTPGRTTMTLFAADGKLISNIEVQVTPDIAEFKERLKQILPGETIEVRTANDGIVLSGVVSSNAKLDRAIDLAERYAPERVSNLLSVGGTQQVMLKVRFAEMQRSVAKNLGVSLAAKGGSKFGVRGESGTYLADGNALGTGDLKLATGMQGGLELGFTAGSIQLGVLLEALESKGVVRTLAEPNLTALSGQEAKFLGGGEYPIPILTTQGIAIVYKPFGVELNFTPTVIDGDAINLQINAAVSAIDTTVTIEAGGFSINAFKRRETSTTVEMRDGESFAVAGLLQDDFRNLNTQLPWLGDVPILGTLFRSADYQRNQSELVIIITPHLVTPTKGDTYALPTDRVRLPTEREFFLNGEVAVTKKGAVGEVARQDFSSSYGYVME